MKGEFNIKNIEITNFMQNYRNFLKFNDFFSKTKGCIQILILQMFGGGVSNKMRSNILVES